MKDALTAERLRELLRYDPTTGVFTWRVNRGRVAHGDVAGSINCDGYVRIRLDGVEYLGHRLGWLYVKGVWPVDRIDHRNCIRDDNRFSNIREATVRQNNRNTLVRSSSRSGLKGASFDRVRGRWRSQIHVAGRQRYLGIFDTAAEAHAAYCEAAIEVDPDFARLA